MSENRYSPLYRENTQLGQIPFKGDSSASHHSLYRTH
jgi:hypothetical protein